MPQRDSTDSTRCKPMKKSEIRFVLHTTTASVTLAVCIREKNLDSDLVTMNCIGHVLLPIDDTQINVVAFML
jgi:hypothetical protein